MTSRTGSARGGFGGFFKKKSVELRTRHRTRRVDFRGSQRPDEFVHYGRGTRRSGWADEKSWNRKNVYLSPYVEEPLNSKVIKSFVPELRSRKCFCVSGFLCSMYICYEHSMYVSRSHIWLWYILVCFLPRLRNSFVAFYRHRRCHRINWGKKKTNGVRYLNPKPATIKQINKTK